jgi:hypothetical protein
VQSTNGDITSLLYNGIQAQDPTKFSQLVCPRAFTLLSGRLIHRRRAPASVLLRVLGSKPALDVGPRA